MGKAAVQHSDLDLRDTELSALLLRLGADATRFHAQQAALRAGQGIKQSNWVQGTLRAPSDSHFVTLGPEAEACGQAMLTRGRVAVAVLAGGMATRFGGVVKALVEAADGRSFLALKLAQIEACATEYGVRVPVALMASFATEAPLKAWLRDAASDYPSLELSVFVQFASLRLNPDGSLFRDTEGAPSPYATGHGDFAFALSASGLLDAWLSAGIEQVFLSNVDNLGATLDAGVLGAAKLCESRCLVEVAPKAPGDAGGIPAVLDGVPQVVEAFRIPPDFDASQVPDFNTNTFTFHIDALAALHPLDFFVAEKRVEGRPAVQFERLVGQISAFERTHFLRVSRDPECSRFIPCKTRDDLKAQQATLRASLRAAGVALS